MLHQNDQHSSEQLRAEEGALGLLLEEDLAPLWGQHCPARCERGAGVRQHPRALPLGRGGAQRPGQVVQGMLSCQGRSPRGMGFGRVAVAVPCPSSGRDAPGSLPVRGRRVPVMSPL